MAEGRGTEFRCAGRADRRDASYSRGREVLEFRKPLLHALNYCMLSPAPRRRNGPPKSDGSCIEYSAASIMALSYIYTVFCQCDLYRGLLLWPEAAVLPIVVQAVVRVGKRALNSGRCNFWRPRHL